MRLPSAPLPLSGRHRAPSSPPPRARRPGSRPRQAAAAGLAVLVLLAACGPHRQEDEETWSLERMLHQPKVEAYEASPVFADGAAMRRPPAGTVPWDEPLGQEAVLHGTRDGRPVEAIPVDLDRDLLRRGRDRFDIWCAACHGLRGDGESPVAANMTLRPPPSLLTPRVRALAPGHVYRVVDRGYGLMPGYGDLMSVRERWAVVAYLQALQLSQAADLAELPAPLAAEARLRASRPPAGNEPPVPLPPPAEAPDEAAGRREAVASPRTPGTPRTPRTPRTAAPDPGEPATAAPSEPEDDG